MEQLQMLFEKKSHFVITMITATCMVTFQAYLVAPISTEIGNGFLSGSKLLRFAIPSFAIPFGISSLLFSQIADRIDRKKITILLELLMSVLLAMLSLVHSGASFLLIRSLIGICSGGIVQISMSVMNDLFKFKDRERAFGWLIMAHAAGMTFGPTFGAYLFPVIGWRLQFVFLSFITLLILIMNSSNSLSLTSHQNKPIHLKLIIRKPLAILRVQGGYRIYSFIYLNGIFHAGLFVWINYYFNSAYHLGYQGIGFVLLLFSLPGLLMATSIAFAIKRLGRVKILLLGLLTCAVTILLILFGSPFYLTLFSVIILSLGYVMTQPFYAGLIETAANRNLRGIKLGLGFGSLFLGYGSGPILFLYLLSFGSFTALIGLGSLTILLLLLSRESKNGTQSVLTNDLHSKACPGGK